MNPFRQLWDLIREPGETPVIARSRVVEQEAMERQIASRQIINRSQSKAGPLHSYIWGEGKKRND